MNRGGDDSGFLLSGTVLLGQNVFEGSIKMLECGCGDTTWELTVIADYESGLST